MNQEHEDLQRYYQDELAYLRQAGTAFARKHPRIASRLELHADTPADPFSERLIESFAWLTSRIRRNIDSRLPLISKSILDNLYPNFSCPIPSMAIAELKPDPQNGDLETGYSVTRGTIFTCRSDISSTPVNFQTAWDTELHTIYIQNTAIEDANAYNLGIHAKDAISVIRLRLSSRGRPLTSCKIDRLRLFLHTDNYTRCQLCNLLGNNLKGVFCIPVANASGSTEDQLQPPIALGVSSFQPAGFSDDEFILPQSEYGHPAYQLLQEYSAFPDKFMFFDICGLGSQLQSENVDILLTFSRKIDLRLTPDVFRTCCVPVINLFSKIAEPIRIDETSLKYRLAADNRNYSTTQIHSILEVNVAEGTTTREVAPFFALGNSRDQDEIYYLATRYRENSEINGSEIYLSFYDTAFNINRPASKSVYARVRCTNRHLAATLPAGTILSQEEYLPLEQATLLQKPTSELEPRYRGETLWELVSHLTLNHLSLTRDVAALKEILQLYASEDKNKSLQFIQGIRSLSSRPSVRRIGNDIWRGFARGITLSITIDEDYFTGCSTYLFGKILSKFLGLYSSINSFVALELYNQKGLLYQWQPATGLQTAV